MKEGAQLTAQPALRVRPPAGDGWLHEVKFDGYRCQLHKAGDEVVIFSKNGRDFTNRFPGIRDALLTPPARTRSSTVRSSPAEKMALQTSARCTRATTLKKFSVFGASI